MTETGGADTAAGVNPTPAALLDDIERVMRLQIALVRHEAREFAIGNLVAVALMAGGGLVLLLAVLVAVPVIVVLASPNPVVAGIAWTVLYLLVGAGLVIAGRMRLS